MRHKVKNKKRRPSLISELTLQGGAVKLRYTGIFFSGKDHFLVPQDD